MVLAILVGAGLGMAGAALQGVFRNPLAEPGVIGVSSGSATGAVAAIVLGFSGFNTGSIAVAAFSGGSADGNAVEVLRAEMLSEVFNQRLMVMPHPHTGAPVVPASFDGHAVFN